MTTTQAWSTIITKLAETSIEMQTVPKTQKTPVWFSASTDGNMIYINRLNRFINSVGDSEMRQILTYRYISGLTWQQIAFNIGEHDEQYPRRKHNRFLEGREG